MSRFWSIVTDMSVAITTVRSAESEGYVRLNTHPQQLRHLPELQYERLEGLAWRNLTSELSIVLALQLWWR